MGDWLHGEGATTDETNSVRRRTDVSDGRCEWKVSNLQSSARVRSTAQETEGLATGPSTREKLRYARSMG